MPSNRKHGLHRQLDDSLRPILGNATDGVISRLGTVIVAYKKLQTNLDQARATKGARRKQALAVYAKFKAFWHAIQASDPDLQAHILDGMGADLLALKHRLESAIEDAINAAPRPGRRQNEMRALVLDEIACALSASGIRPSKTEDGTFDQVSRIVLHVAGEVEPPGDFRQAIRAAVDRHRKRGCYSEADAE